jgi:hypothetical protein
MKQLKKDEMDQLKPEGKDVSDREAKEKALELAAHEDVEIAEKEGKVEDKAKLKNDKKYFEELRNAHFTKIVDPVKVDLDKMARGKARYGSN